VRVLLSASYAGRCFTHTKSKRASLESDTILRDIQLDQEQPLPENGTWSPDDSFDYIVRAKRGDIIIENIKIFKAYRGIAVGGLGEGVGRVQLRNIRAGAFASGILIDDAMDVVRVAR
jgi:hypothetical protein